MVKKIVKEYFSESRIALMKEVKMHPDLVTALTIANTNDWFVQLAHIAAYCHVMIDGFYGPKELDELAGALHQKLRSKGQIIVGRLN